MPRIIAGYTSAIHDQSGRFQPMMICFSHRDNEGKEGCTDLL